MRSLTRSSSTSSSVSSRFILIALKSKLTVQEEKDSTSAQSAVVGSLLRSMIVIYIRCGISKSFWEYPSDYLVTAGDNEDGVFVKTGTKFIITDDLQVAPSSTSLVFDLLDRFGLQDQANLEEKNLELNFAKVRWPLQLQLHFTIVFLFS